MRHLWCACTKFQPNPASRRALSRSQSSNGSRKTTRIIPSVSNNQILKAMRKSFVYAAGLMCLALSITDCQKELVDQTTPASEPNFELLRSLSPPRLPTTALTPSGLRRTPSMYSMPKPAQPHTTATVGSPSRTSKPAALTERFPNPFLPTNRMTGMRSIRIPLRFRHLEIGKSVGLLSAEHHRLRQAMAAVCISPGSLVLSTVSPQMSLLTKSRPFR